MNYVSTRNGNTSVNGYQAVFQGISTDGGLFVPSDIPKLGLPRIKGKSYAQFSAEIMGVFFDKSDVLSICNQAYSTANFSHDRIAPVGEREDDCYYLELYHGPTCAFKDLALQVLPKLLACAVRSLGRSEEICILTATSGDTGKAALEGFKDQEGTKVIVFYPVDGVSDIQKLQMVTQSGKNVGVCAVEGNFDDAQTGVKNLFANQHFVNELLNRKIVLSSANSINIGRLIPQIAYYFSAYADLTARGDLQPNEPVNFCVPTGNFGNILAGWYAKQMGLPINKLVCASNRNSVLTDFFSTGEYSISRDFYTTHSPSMDILISSNFERALYHFSGNDCDYTVNVMNELKSKKMYKVSSEMLHLMQRDFSAYCCNDSETLSQISETYSKTGRVLDPHTAVARFGYSRYVKETGDTTKTVIVSTASPYKFADSVLRALGSNSTEIDALNSYTKTEIPAPLQGLSEKDIRFKGVTTIENMQKAAFDLLGNM